MYFRFILRLTAYHSFLKSMVESVIGLITFLPSGLDTMFFYPRIIRTWHIVAFIDTFELSVATPRYGPVRINCTLYIEAELVWSISYLTTGPNSFKISTWKHTHFSRVGAVDRHHQGPRHHRLKEHTGLFFFTLTFWCQNIGGGPQQEVRRTE